MIKSTFCLYQMYIMIVPFDKSLYDNQRMLLSLALIPESWFFGILQTLLQLDLRIHLTHRLHELLPLATMKQKFNKAS
jgi:hypothetical protein